MTLFIVIVIVILYCKIDEKIRKRKLGLRGIRRGEEGGTKYSSEKRNRKKVTKKANFTFLDKLNMLIFFPKV